MKSVTTMQAILHLPSYFSAVRVALTLRSTIKELNITAATHKGSWPFLCISHSSKYDLPDIRSGEIDKFLNF